MARLDRRTLLLAGLAARAAAAQPATPPDGSLFARVIKNPTGLNGYEELVAAADALKSSALFQQVEQRMANSDAVPLAASVAALRDPTIGRALGLLHRGLAK